MPTYTFTRTREQLASAVLRKLTVLAAGETANADDMAIVYEAIDLRLKEMHQLGSLWYQVTGTTTNVTLTLGVSTAAVPADFLFPVSMAVRVGTADNALEIIDHRAYQAIEDKTETGEPEKVFVSGSTFIFWPVPNIAYTAKLTYEAIAADTAAGAAPDIPVAMMRALAVVIAYDLRTDFAVPTGTKQDLATDVIEARRTIMSLNAQRVDTSVVQMSAY